MRWVRRILIGLVILFVVIQLVPYGRDHSNPNVVQDAPWPDARSATLARTSCYDCHSNETDWPVYSNVAPISWLVQRDVDEGRDKLNFSRWDESQAKLDKAADQVERGKMPPANYTRIHSSAKLSDEEQQVLVAALLAMPEGGDAE
jgi:hypothetical protein